MTNIDEARSAATTATERGEWAATAAEAVEVKSEAEYEMAAKVLAEVKREIKALDGQRLEFTRPLNKVVRDINDFFRRPLDAYRRAEKKLKTAMVAFRDAQRQVQKRALAEAQAAAREGDRIEFSRQLAAAQDAIPEAEGTHTRQKWCFEVVDPAAVPREYLVVDEKAVGAVVRRDKDKTSIPGIRVWSEDVVVVR